MARTPFRLTDRTVRNLNAPGYHPDGGGLYLQISKTSTKCWIFRYTLKGRTRDMGLGALAAVTLADALAKIVENRALLAKRCPPRRAPRPLRPCPTSRGRRS